MTVLRPIDVAERWQCSEAHVRNLYRRCQLTGFKAGGKLLRFRLSDVEAYECASSNIAPPIRPSGGKAASDTAAALARMTG
jgi:hypothetical protein